MAIYSINALPNSLYLGKQTETGVREIRIDCAPWFALWPNLSISVWVTPPGSAAAYPAAVQLEGEVLTWPITSADTATAGGGYVEIMGTAEGQKKLSATVPTLIQATTTGATTTPPDSARPWVDQVLEAAERAEAAAERAESAGSSGGSAGGIVIETDPTVYDWAKQPQKPTYTADEVNAIDKDALPQAIEAALAQAKENGEFDGAPGSKGDPGADGGYYQPSVTDGVLSWTPSKADMPSVPASDVRGPSGQDGQPGKDGAPGKTAYQYAQDGGYTGTAGTWAGQVLTANISVDQGSKPTPIPAPTTAVYDLLHADSYAAGNVNSWVYPEGKPNDDIYQGYTGQAGRICGCMWFDNTAIRNALSGKTIRQASIRLTAQRYVGYGREVTVYLRGTATSYSGRSGPPALTTDYGMIGTAEPAVTGTFTIPAQAISDIASGRIEGLVLYHQDTADMQGKNYSRNYMRFDGSTSGNAETRPRLTVVYQ